MQILATSQQPLRAEGEWIYRPPPLEAPPEDAGGTADLLAYSAVKLFVARARAAQPCLRFDGRTAAAAAQICRRLDGIPLAIELAAATAAGLGVEGLASRLDDRLSLLTDGRRTAPARHRTLRAALDWSYGLLSEPERRVVRRLAVFGGEFTMEEASAIAANDADIVPGVAGLVTKSFVVRDDTLPIARFRLLRAVRRYAMERLAESGGAESLAAALPVGR